MERDACIKCGQFSLIEDDGSTVCTFCGYVADRAAIINSVEFSESGGGSSIVGQIVSGSTVNQFGSGYQFNSRPSQDITILNGKKILQGLCNSLHIEGYLDRSYRLYMSSVFKNIVQGRSATLVCAACLYIVCRQEDSPLLLIDFADVLQVNVFQLGSMYVKIRTDLNINKLKIVDPGLYIHRFADRLDFGSDKPKVILTSLRIVARMKRDWIVQGRRPIGICAAAILIASRLHGFQRSSKEIVSIIQIGEDTVRHRINEFNVSPSGNLSPDEFDLLAEQTNNFAVDMNGSAIEDDGMVPCDPPCYIKNHYNEYKDQFKQYSFLIPKSKRINLDDIYEQIENEIELKNYEKADSIIKSNESTFDVRDYFDQSKTSANNTHNNLNKTQEIDSNSNNDDHETNKIEITQDKDNSLFISSLNDDKISTDNESDYPIMSLTDTADEHNISKLPIAHTFSDNDQRNICSDRSSLQVEIDNLFIKPDTKIRRDEDESNIRDEILENLDVKSEVNDTRLPGDISSLFLNETDKTLKEQVWNELFSDWEEKQKYKELNNQHSNHNKTTKKKRKRNDNNNGNNYNKDGKDDSSSVIPVKKFSKKINYDLLDSLF